jgi:histidinol-phosphate aminotransferase
MSKLNLELGVVETSEADTNYPSPQLEKTLVDTIAAKVLAYTKNPTYPVIGAGSDQLLERLAFILSSPSNLHIIPQPAYFSHIEYLEKNHAKTLRFEYSLENASIDLAKKIKGLKIAGNYKNKFVWITTPNNPSGINIDIEPLLGSDVSIIVDEAYGEFSDKTPFSSSAIRYGNDNLYVLRSFSKGLGLAGIRLGYLLTQNNDIVEALRVSLPLFPASRDSLEKGIKAFNNYEEDTDKIRDIADGRRTYFMKQLKKAQQTLANSRIDLHYVQPEAITCMIWAERKSDKLDLHQFLLDNDIHVQNLRNIEGLPQDAIRVTMAEKEKTDSFMNSLHKLSGVRIAEYLKRI